MEESPDHILASCMIFWRKGSVFIHAEDQTVDGAWIAEPPFVTIVSPSATALGGEVLSALARSRLEVPHPTTWKPDRLEPLYSAAAVKNWAAFVRGARCTSVERRVASVSVLPMKNVGAAGGFVPIEEGRGSSAPRLIVCPCGDRGSSRVRVSDGQWQKITALRRNRGCMKTTYQSDGKKSSE
jgi:hypothetical protein